MRRRRRVRTLSCTSPTEARWASFAACWPGCPAVGDPSPLRIVLQNLLDNAWKFTRRAAAPHIESGMRQVGPERRFFVADNGVGFDMAFTQRLFRPLQRPHPSADFPGTGVGLATVKRIVRRHGGRIWAESHPGQGTTFWFTL